MTQPVCFVFSVPRPVAPPATQQSPPAVAGRTLTAYTENGQLSVDKPIGLNHRCVRTAGVGPASGRFSDDSSRVNWVKLRKKPRREVVAKPSCGQHVSHFSTVETDHTELQNGLD